ncbi:DNA repair exonuclease, partial [Staphylococcus epidermidis]
PQIHYSGNIQGRHFNERGEKGCLLVSGDDLKLNVKFIPTQSIRFEEATIETEADTKQKLYEAIQNFKAKKRSQGKAFY